jgi:hypothetical protein
LFGAEKRTKVTQWPGQKLQKKFELSRSTQPF